MTFSLSYAFGATGRHVRKISREARAVVGANFQNLEPSRLRDVLFANFFAIDSTLFSVFYNDDPNHRLHSIHKKYANKLIDATESDFRHLARAYAFSLLARQPLGSATEEEMVRRVNILALVAFIYDGSGPTEPWTSLILQPDESTNAVCLCQEIAQVLKLDPHDKITFSSDWLSLIASIVIASNTLLAKDDWSMYAASLLQSTDYGGSQS